MSIQDLSEAIDAASVDALKQKRRKHLGPSTLSGKCFRSSWYTFRWCSKEESLQGDMARLLDRGHQEEHRIYQWFRAAGVEVRDYAERLMYHEGSDSYICIGWDAEPSYGGREADDQIWTECDDVSKDSVHIKRATSRGQGPKQWGFSTHGGHYSGSSDGLIRGLDKWLPQAVGWGLAECKTSSEKNFAKLAGPKGKWMFAENKFEPRSFNPNIHGLQRAKPEHYRQMQQYMRQLQLSWGLYIAVNKNTDEIYYEFVPVMPEVGDYLFNTAAKIITAQTPPEKVSQDPSWFGCKVCDHVDVCHYGAAPERNCRSCVFSIPDNRAVWRCNKYQREIPDNFIYQGCECWEPTV